MTENGVNILLDFFESHEGVVVTLSDDKVIHRTLRTAVHKAVGTQRNCLYGMSSRKAALKRIRKLEEADRPIVALVERRINDTPGTDFILDLSKTHPSVKIILLTGRIEAESLAYLHELGVVSVVVKPASINNLIEKMANAVKPPDSLRKLVDRARGYLEQGEFEDAERTALKILDIKPGSPAGLMLLGDIRLQLGERQAAISAYLAAHNEAEMYMEPLKRLVEAFKDLDDDEVLKYLSRLDWISPLNPDRKQEIGEAYLRKDDREQAEQYFDRCLEIVSEELPTLLPSVVSGIADAVEAESPAMAAKYLRRGLDAHKDSLGPKDIAVFNRLGIALRKQGQWQDAVMEYDRAIMVSPHDAGLHYNQALAWYDGNRRAEALAAMRKALDIDPDLYKSSDTTAMNVGNVFLHAGSPERALPYYETAMLLNPGNARAKARLAETRRLLDSSVTGV